MTTIMTPTRICDICGAPVGEYGYITVTDPKLGIIYESRIRGDYCPEHANMLLDAAIAALPISERMSCPRSKEEIEEYKREEREAIEKIAKLHETN